MIDINNDIRERKIYNVTILGSFVNLLLLIFKFLAGILGNSAAMIADAVHSLSDFVTDIIVLVFVRISNKPQDKSHDYGHGKYETLATALIGFALLVVGIGIFWNGVMEIIDSFSGVEILSPSPIALVAAFLSILAKEMLYRYTKFVGTKFKSKLVIANAWHHRSDALSSFGTLAGIGGAIFLGSKWRVLDPIAAIVVSFFIMKASIQMLIPCIEELLEKSLPDNIEKEIESIILSVKGVTEPHNLRTRRIGNDFAIEMHIRMDGNITLDEAHLRATLIENKLREKYGKGTYIGIHVEPIK